MKHILIPLDKARQIFVEIWDREKPKKYKAWYTTNNYQIQIAMNETKLNSIIKKDKSFFQKIIDKIKEIFCPSQIPIEEFEQDFKDANNLYFNGSTGQIRAEALNLFHLKRFMGICDICKFHDECFVNSSTITKCRFFLEDKK